MYSYSLFPCVTKPTHVTSKTASLIDNIFCNNIVDNQDVGLFTGILYTDISDHFPKESLELFSNLLQNNDWSDVLSSDNPQDAFQLFSDCYRDVYDKCLPLRTIKYGYKTRKPWLSEGLKRSIQTKNKLFHRKQKTKRLEHETIYKKYRNKLNKLLLMAERKHYEQRLEEYKCNLNGSWRVLKDIIYKKKDVSSCSRFLVNNKVTSDKQIVGKGFNSFFINTGANLAKSIPSDPAHLQCL